MTKLRVLVLYFPDFTLSHRWLFPLMKSSRVSFEDFVVVVAKLAIVQKVI
jgi:hypothetical protein